MGKQPCDYCTEEKGVERKELMYTGTSDYKVIINECNYLEDNVVGGTIPHSVYGIKINYCPMCGQKLEKNEANKMTQTNRNGWEHHELAKEMQGANLADLITLYKREDEKCSELCQELVRNIEKFTEEGKEEFMEQLNLQKEALAKVAVAIADMMTKATKK